MKLILAFLIAMLPLASVAQSQSAAANGVPSSFKPSVPSHIIIYNIDIL